MRASSSWASGGGFLGRPEGAAGEQASNSVCQSIKAEGRNAEEALRDDQELFGEDAQLHLLPQIGCSKVSRGRHQHD